MNHHHHTHSQMIEQPTQPGNRHHDHHSEPMPAHDGKAGAHNKHAGHHTHDFLKRFWICLVITVPVLFLSRMIQQWFGFELNFPGDKYLLLVLSSVIYFYGGVPFLKGMISEIRDKAIGMMTLVALAISVALIYSIAVAFGLKGTDFFWELATLIDIMLLGHWLEMRSEMAASKALESLVALLPAVVHVEREREVVDIDVNDLQRDEVMLIKPGEKIAADGVVMDGNSSVNESMLTGESIPVKKEKNAKVIAGSINGDGFLKVKVTGAGKDSYLNKVISLVHTAQTAKSNTQNVADKVAKWLTIISLLVGVTTFIAWFARHDWHLLSKEW